jgi:hypothetical protein
LKPYFNDGQVTIYHGDCRSVLSSLPVCDLLLTDPPYGIAWQSGRGEHEILTGDDGSVPSSSWLNLALRKVRRGRHVYIFGLHSSDIPSDMSLCGIIELVWDKGLLGLGDMESPWGPSHETILFGVQEISKANRAKGYGATAARLRKGSVLRVQRPHSGQTLRHPTEKPVELLRILIESSSTFGETVLDPFMGSGSTLEAARLEGRKCIGIEVEEKFCAIAAERLSNYQDALRL